MQIRHHKAEGKFDTLIVDCAPTGETLQLLAFPDVARWYLQRLFPASRAVMKVARPVVQPFVSIPLPPTTSSSTSGTLLLDLESMKSILGDPKTCTVRLVLNLEKMVLKEAQRAFTYLSLYDYLTDLVVVNRVLPPEVTDTYFAILAGDPDPLRRVGRVALRPHPHPALQALRPRDRRPRPAGRAGGGALRR